MNTVVVWSGDFLCGERYSTTKAAEYCAQRPFYTIPLKRLAEHYNGDMRDSENNILIHAGCTPDIVAHCMAVSRSAVSITKQVKIPVDDNLVKLGGLLHDIGRSRAHGIDHALVGAEIATKLGFPKAVVRIIECHIGAGITAAEAERLGLPKRNYIPITPEEKIVSYADNLLSGIKQMTFCEALDRFRKILGTEHEGIQLFIQQHEEIQTWMK